MYIIASAADGKMNAMIADAVMQVSSSPTNLAVTINKKNLTHDIIMKSYKFSVSVLSKEADMMFIGRFGFRSGREVDKFKDMPYIIGKTGVPVITKNAVGYMEVEVKNTVDVGSHTMFIGPVVSDVLLGGEEMSYDYYHTALKGKVGKNAPTYSTQPDDGQETKKQKGGEQMDKYVCNVCGYIYDPEKGDPDGGIKPGTPFKDIPDDWVCPVCGVTKDQFTKLE